ncbi:MAG: hypothetical protein ABR573_02840 [Candidatus Dormibacteria bacterium]
MPSPTPPSSGDLAGAVSALRDAAETAALRLSGDDADADLQELAGTLEQLERDCEALTQGARGKWKTRLGEAQKHFHEARDLLDDGEPADAVALEVMSAREGLRN